MRNEMHSLAFRERYLKVVRTVEKKFEIDKASASDPSLFSTPLII